MSKNLNLTKTDNTGYDASIDQGVDYAKITFQISGDYSTWTPKGSIRSNWFDLEPLATPLAVFSFASLSYDNTKNRTTIIPTLTATQTAAIPFTNNRFDIETAPIIGFSVFVYDIDLTSPLGAIIRLSSGYVEVSPRVTI